MGIRARGAVLDGLLATTLMTIALAAAVRWPGVRPIGAGGMAMIVAAHLPLLWRRQHPGAVLVAVMAVVLPFHLCQFQHHAVVPVEALALLNFAILGRRVRAVLVGTMIVLTLCAAVFSLRMSDGDWTEQIAVIEAAVAVVVAIQAWRVHRARVAAITERAENERVEERLRIARDLHDLLAHSITVIGVQAGAAAHQLKGDRPLDRDELAATFGSIAATCRETRAELRATLQVLRQDEASDAIVVPPGVEGLPDLAGAARAAGLEAVLVEDGDDRPPPEVGIVVYRIVQEAMTNVVKHARAARVEIRVTYGDDLTLTVSDDGCGPSGDGNGFGILGMSERALSVGGTLRAGAGENGGFTVTAVLPMVLDATTIEMGRDSA
ncbi:sensor histidine kinase [Spirillospora sp. CA-294931]|uniref:sensor histidine kinase n=1 Tax=Spirillospora sp. CA-294931 TaxID=3240042 RepID=UPI003D92805C